MKKTALLSTAVFAALLLSLSISQAQVSIYDNTENFEGSTGTNGGVTGTTGNRYTYLIADDLSFPVLAAGLTVSQFSFSVGNANSTSQAIKPQIRFWNSDGTNGGPGTLLAAYNFNALTIAANTVSGFNYAPAAASSFILPTSGTVWAGITFLNSGTSETAAVINNFGQGLFNPPLIGTSTDQAFFSSATGTFAASNPAGSIVATPYSASGLVANFEWQLQVLTLPVPEPSTWAMFGVGMLSCAGVVFRRRSNG